MMNIPRLQIGKSIASQYSTLPKARLVALGVSFILHAGLFAWFLWNPAWNKSVSQSTMSPTPIFVSIVTMAGEPVPAPEELIKKPVSMIKPDSSAVKKQEPKFISDVPMPETKNTQERHKAVQPQLSGQQRQAVQQGDLTTAGASSGEADYYDIIQAWLEKHKTYPRMARVKGLEGKVMVSFTFGRNGRILSKHVTKSSGHEVLDTAALRALEAATPLPEMPEEVSGQQMTLNVPFDFYFR